MQAVILAGGKGTRLKPFTNSIPKPLVPIGDKSILEIVLLQLKNAGISEIFIAVNHLAELIIDYFGDGSQIGIKIKYSKETINLGTAGPLKIINGLNDNFLVLNGDILTTLDFNKLYIQHLKSDCLATIATYKKEIKIDLGVLEFKDNGEFQNYIEKPTFTFTVSTGIYVFNKKILDHIPVNIKFDMPDLILLLNKMKYPIYCFTDKFEWLDIGRVDDYKLALEIFKKNKLSYLKNG